MHDIAYDPIHDEIVVTSPFTQAILTFRGGASGEEPPLRVIQGPHTQILGVGGIDKVSIDPEHNEIFLATANQNIVVFPREANGDVTPIRVLAGPDTQIKFTEQTVGNGNTPPIRIDPVHNLLIVPSNGQGGDRYTGGGTGGSLLIFDRAASGNAKPLRVIKGPKTGLGNLRGQIDVYGAKGWIIVNTGSAINVWNVADN